MFDEYKYVNENVKTEAVALSISALVLVNWWVEFIADKNYEEPNLSTLIINLINVRTNNLFDINMIVDLFSGSIKLNIS